MRIKNIRLPLLLLSLVLVAACGKKSSEVGSRIPPPAGPSATRTSLADRAGREMESITFGGRGITISGSDGGVAALTGETRANGTRSYVSAGTPVAVVSQGNDESFKLKDAHGTLLWKVKLAPDKIKVSDNEENEHPYVLRLEDGHVKVKDDETEIGRVRFRNDSLAADVTDGSGGLLRTVKGKSGSVAPGVILMSRVPYPDRLIIMAELIARER